MSRSDPAKRYDRAELGAVRDAEIADFLFLAISTGVWVLRLRARTHTDRDARRADLAAALGIARQQGADFYELRAALDDFELRGEPAHAALVNVFGRFAADSPLPE